MRNGKPPGFVGFKRASFEIWTPCQELLNDGGQKEWAFAPPTGRSRCAFEGRPPWGIYSFVLLGSQPRLVCVLDERRSRFDVRQIDYRLIPKQMPKCKKARDSDFVILNPESGEDWKLLSDSLTVIEPFLFFSSFNREGTFYYKEAVRLQKVADKLLDHLEARVKGTLDGTVPVRKASLQRGERASVLQRPTELDLPVQSRLMKPSMPGKTPRGLGDADALPSISASSVEESYRAGAEEGFREGEAGRKRKERGEEREESESGKRRREDSDAESNRLRGKRPREEDDLDEYRASERRRVDSARRPEAEGKRPISAPLQWERDEKRKRSKFTRPEFPRTEFPRLDSRGGSSQDVGRGGAEAEVQARRAAARRRQRIVDDSESDSDEWASTDTEEEQDSGAESLGDATESEEVRASVVGSCFGGPLEPRFELPRWWPMKRLQWLLVSCIENDCSAPWISDCLLAYQLMGAVISFSPEGPPDKVGLKAQGIVNHERCPAQHILRAPMSDALYSVNKVHHGDQGLPRINF
jgi:hypothetical protein